MPMARKLLFYYEFLADREQVREWMEEELDDMCERIDFVSDDGQEDLKRRRK